MLRGFCCTSSLLVIALAACSLAQAVEAKVSVHLASGRDFTGILDSRTNAEKLWLRWRVGEIELQRPIAWERIESAELDDAAIKLSELQERAAELATPGRVPQLRAASPSALPEPSLAISRPVHSIHCDAWLSNWDTDAEFDGLMLQVEALDQDGAVVPARGTVEAELITLDYGPTYLNASSGGRTPTSLGRWNQAWTAPEQLRLELQGRDPQREGRLDRYALLKVRVTIPGSGVFEQQMDGLRMRPFTPVQNNRWR